jgi:hypothetical protein
MLVQQSTPRNTPYLRDPLLEEHCTSLVLISDAAGYAHQNRNETTYYAEYATHGEQGLCGLVNSAQARKTQMIITKVHLERRKKQLTVLVLVLSESEDPKFWDCEKHSREREKKKDT